MEQPWYLIKAPIQNTKGLVYESNADNTSSNNVRFGDHHLWHWKSLCCRGSSKPDDGNRDPGDTLYDGYFFNAVGNHRILLLNAVYLALATSSGLATDDIMEPETFSKYLYPSKGLLCLCTQSKTSEKYHLT